MVAMTERVLTADLGNSAIKLAVWELDGEDPTLVERSRVEWGGELGRVIREFGAVVRVLACRVTKGARFEEFSAACEAAGLPSPREPRLDLAISCRDAHTIGRDRLFAARGAWARCRSSALVVDAGTALTVDALGVDVDGAPVFLGGAIAPGPELLAASLARGAAQLFEVRADPHAPALGQDSHEALVSGVSVGFVGAARELVARVGAEAGLEGAPLALTGGAAHFLESALVEMREVFHEPELVALGLLAADVTERAL